MKKYEIVKSHEQFNEVINKGNKISNKYFIIFSLAKEDKKPQFGIAVGKKVGNAVVRNKFKRQIRNIIDNNKFLFKNNRNYIIMIKKECLNVSYNLLEQNLINLIRKDQNEK